MTTLTPEDLRNLEHRLADPVWRVCHLYEVKDAKTGRMVRFVPSPEQREIILAVHERLERAILILKARQLGMSTVINLILADAAIWNAGYQGSIVDQTQGDATLKLRHKVKAAFDSMPELLREMFDVVKANDSEFAVRMKGRAGSQTSTIFGGMNARGGTNQLLHISEWGPIQHKDPVRSEEIMTGALPSAKEGTVFIETTWMGGKRGHLWNLTDRAMTTRAEDMTDADFHLYFFPWWKDASYTLNGNFEQLDAETLEYFEQMRRETEHDFTPGQMLWYFKVALPKGLARFAEYPTTLPECFMAPVPGAIWAKFIDKAKAEGRVMDFPWDRSELVHTSWDLGSPKNTRCVYFQCVGREIHIIDHDTGLDLEPAARVGWMKQKGYHFGSHFFPHDAAAQEKSGKNFEEQMRDAGLEGIVIVPRCREVWPGINKAAELLPRMVFHKTRCAKLLESLECYHTKEERTSGHLTSIPVHDWSSHDADAFRMLAEAMLNGLLKGQSEVIRDHRQPHQRQKVASAGRYKR
jgi:hypothetical protein